LTTLGPYTALGHAFDVAMVDGDDPRLEELLAPLVSSDVPEATYRVALPKDEEEPGWIEVGDDRTPAKDLAGIRERLLLAIGRRIQADATDPLLHACLVDVGGRGVLVTGPSGSGKSTLTARLAAKGAALVAEDLALLDHQGRVRPYHRPLALAAESLEALDLEVPEDDCRCGCMKHLLQPAELGGSFGGPVPVALVVFCQGQGRGVQELSLAQALTRLFVDGGLDNVDASERLAAVASALAGAHCAEIGTADLDAAVGAITRLLGDPAREVSVAADSVSEGAVVYLDGEALVHVDGQVHHLDAAAPAVWVLHTEGEGADAIADETGLAPEVVVETLARLQELGLPAPTR
jgi:hypothetical protein